MTLAQLFQDPFIGSAMGFGLGAVLGLAHFATLRIVTALYLGGGSPLRAIALQLTRLVLLAGGLIGLALLGALPLLAGALGVLLARQVVLRRARQSA